MSDHVQATQNSMTLVMYEVHKLTRVHALDYVTMDYYVDRLRTNLNMHDRFDCC